MTLKKMIVDGLKHFHILHGEEEADNLCFFIEELERWNKRINLVGLKDLESMVRELLYDAFFLYGHVRDYKKVVDMGSGSGIVGIPCAILNKKLHIFSIDSSLKKIHFQRHIKRSLHLKGLTLIEDRVEALESLKVDCIVVKAFGSIQDILTKGGKHVRRGGYVFIVKGTGEEVIPEDTFILKEQMPYRLPMIDKTHRLFVFQKRM